MSEAAERLARNKETGVMLYRIVRECKTHGEYLLAVKTLAAERSVSEQHLLDTSKADAPKA